MVKLSIIVPVFDHGKSLDKFVDSVLSQKVDDIEIICIGNYSTKSLLEKIKSIQEKDKRIIIAETESNKTTEILNEGMDISNGDYLIFSNVKYIFLENSLNSILKIINKESYDILLSKIRYIDPNNSDNECMEHISRIVTDESFNYEILKDFLSDLTHVPWNKTYKKSFLAEQNIKFSDNLHENYEVFFFKSMLKAERIMFNKEYILEDEKNPQSSIYEVEDYIQTTYEIEELLDSLNLNEHKEKMLNYKISTLTEKYDKLSANEKVKAFTIIKEDMVKILEDNQESVDKLAKKERKIFEYIILSHNAEEFDILRKISEENNMKNSNKRYANLLHEEYDKLVKFNNSLTSSNSWKITRIFRLR